MLASQPDMPCPCGDGRPYADCCQPLHQGRPAAGAGRLMRSRASAYVLGLIDWLVQTSLPAQQALRDRQAREQWSRESEWLGREVAEDAPDGGTASRARVSFVARWADPDGT